MLMGQFVSFQSPPPSRANNKMAGQEEEDPTCACHRLVSSIEPINMAHSTIFTQRFANLRPIMTATARRDNSRFLDYQPIICDKWLSKSISWLARFYVIHLTSRTIEPSPTLLFLLLFTHTAHTHARSNIQQDNRSARVAVIVEDSLPTARV